MSVDVILRPAPEPTTVVLYPSRPTLHVRTISEITLSGDVLTAVIVKAPPHVGKTIDSFEQEWVKVTVEPALVIDSLGAPSTVEVSSKGQNRFPD